MTLKFVTDYLDEKIAKNQEFISCSVYDLRVNHNLSSNTKKSYLSEIGFENSEIDKIYTELRLLGIGIGK